MTTAPTVSRYCKRCGAKAAFSSSGLFRVNAQQNRLDVWLIYKCSVCDSTWNLTVLSRITPQSLPADVLQGFYKNDSILAMRYATDTALIKRNGGTPGQPGIEIAGEDVDLADSVRIRLIADQPLDIKVEAILRKRLGLSRNGLDRMLSGGTLVCISGHDIRKCKLSGEIILELSRT